MTAEEFQSLLDAQHPVTLGHLPTPLEPLPRLGKAIGGPTIWVKRDDLTGLATGGNKVRKLAYLMGEAVHRRADVVMTTGAQQSNHARQTAAAAAKLGLRCVLVLRGEAPTTPQGNYLLDRLVGAEVRWAGDRSIFDALEEEADALRSEGAHPYVIPYGGSNEIGVLGYAAAMAELLIQMRSLVLYFDTMVVASSSGGTQAGMILGARALDYHGRIVGISIAEPAPAFRAHIAELATAGAEHLGLSYTFTAEEVEVYDDYLGGGYGVVGELERDAIRLAASEEGLLVDPVYTGRALGGLIDLIRRQEISSDARVLFWHTGGTPALFAYAPELL